MKNLHVLPTDKPSRLYFDVVKKELLLQRKLSIEVTCFPIEKRNIYITNDEYIGLSYYLDGDLVRKGVVDDKYYWEVRKDYKKIILTTDQDLIKDGVQAIDDEFLEWFVKNASCESIEVIKDRVFRLDEFNQREFYNKYKIIIPKEKTKKETLEEVAKNYINKQLFDFGDLTHVAERQAKQAFKNGAKWQQQQNKNLYIELAERIANNYSISYMTDDGIETSKLKKEKVLKIANDYINELNLQSSK